MGSDMANAEASLGECSKLKLLSECCYDAQNQLASLHATKPQRARNE